MKTYILRDKKRRIIFSDYEEDRIILSSILREESFSDYDRLSFRLDLQKMSRDSSKTRIRKRCFITGRSRSNCYNVGLSRIKFREIVHLGLIPGIRKY